MCQGAVSLLSVILAVAAISCGGGGSGTKTPIATSSTNVRTATLPAGLQAVDGNYSGVLGNFKINQGSIFDAKPCSASLGHEPPFPSDYHTSELWVDAFTSKAQPNYCADDDRLTAIFEYRESSILKRGYFYNLPLVVNFNRLREPPRLLDVEGYDAIVGIDAPGSEQVYLYAIERDPRGDAPGIFVFVLGPSLDVPLAQRLASQLLR